MCVHMTALVAMLQLSKANKLLCINLSFFACDVYGRLYKNFILRLVCDNQDPFSKQMRLLVPILLDLVCFLLSIFFIEA